MKSVADWVEETEVEQLATPSNLRLGAELAESGGVEFEEFSPLKVRGKVSGVQRRTVELRSTPDGLDWECSCNSAEKLFCKHLVAAALETWRKSPKRRS